MRRWEVGEVERWKEVGRGVGNEVERWEEVVSGKLRVRGDEM